MQTKDEDRWRFLNAVGRCDIHTYDDGSVGFIPWKDGFPTFGGKEWQSAVDNGVRKYTKAGLFK